MSSVQDGQILEACLFLLDQDPHPHPSFGCPAISIKRAAEQLLLHDSALSSSQVVQAIAPLAETLFRTPRKPIPRVHQGERWIVFDEPGASTAPKRPHRRNSVVGRPPPDTFVPPVPALPTPPARNGTRPLQLISKRPPQSQAHFRPLPSAPLKQSSSGELVADLDVHLPSAGGGELQPKSAGHGKRSFLRPFLLRGKAKQTTDTPSPVSTSIEPAPTVGQDSSGQGQPDSGWTHVPDQAPSTAFEMVDTPSSDVSGSVDDYLEESESVVDSPYEETAFTSGSPPTAPLPPHPLRQSTVPLQPKPGPREKPNDSLHNETQNRTAHEGGSAAEARAETYEQADRVRQAKRTDLHAPVQGHSEASSSASSAGPDAVAVRRRNERSDHSSNENSSQDYAHERSHLPKKGAERHHSSRETESGKGGHDVGREEEKGGHHSRSREKRHAERDDHEGQHRELRRHRSERRHHEQKDDDGRHSKARDHHGGHGGHRSRGDKRSDDGERRSRRARKSEEPPSWFEGVFDGLPFGPNHTTVKVTESVRRDWRLFLAELVALIGLAYVVQASGW